MDGPQFDDLVRVLAVGSPRREALHVLVGGALGLLGWLGLDEAAAHDLMAKCKKIKGKKMKKACVKKAKKHAAQHLSEGSSSSSSPDPCAGVTCPAISNGTAACQNGACVVASCQTGFTQCGNACVDVQLNPQHCGKCGVVCPGDDASRCVNGRCQKTFTTPGAHPYVAPSDGKVTVEAIGARGGNGGSGGNGNVSSGGAGGPGGAAGRVTAAFDVAAGDSLQIDVGETGGDGFPGASFTLGGGGGMPRPVSVNGGAKGATGGNGASGTGGGGGAGGNGGGASNVRHHGNRIVVAGGGGGGGGAGGGANGGGAGGTGGAGSGVAGGDSTSGGGAPGQGGRPASGPGGVGGFGGSGIGPVGSTFGTACCQPSPPDTCVGCSLANLSNGTTCCTEDARVTVTFTAA